jgi:hypothetical protein
MSKNNLSVVILSFLIGSCSLAFAGPKKVNPFGTQTLTKQTLLDKVKGGWAGKTIGCTYGGPVEFKYNGSMIQDYVPIKWDDSRIQWYFDHAPGLYDDVYVDLSFVDVIERMGYEAPADSFAVAFARAGYPLWHANQSARYNVVNGIMPPASGYWKNNPHADDIDFQIEADFAGIMTPGMPNTCSKITDKVGHIMNYGDGWYGGVFVSSLYTMAYISSDINFIVNEALKTIPAQSKFYRCISDVIKWHKAYPNDWKQTWFECQKKWSSDIGCPDGVFSTFDIDAMINSAYVAIGLLYGHGDFGKSIDIAARCGQDADCNPSTVGGILGVMHGYSNIPAYWRNSLKSVENRPFAHTTYSLNKAYEVSFKHALMMIQKEGGKVTDTNVTFKCQQPVPVRYEQSFTGLTPYDRIGIKKDFDHVKDPISFNAKGVVVTGYVQCPKNADYVAQVSVSIDGKDMGTFKMPNTNNRFRRNDLYWNYDLQPGSHNLLFKWLNPSEDAHFYVGDLILYK